LNLEKSANPTNPDADKKQQTIPFSASVITKGRG
jgi:hypothetical protein